MSFVCVTAGVMNTTDNIKQFHRFPQIVVRERSPKDASVDEI
jgi:hypothetical protein